MSVLGACIFFFCGAIFGWLLASLAVAADDSGPTKFKDGDAGE